MINFSDDLVFSLSQKALHENLSKDFFTSLNPSFVEDSIIDLQEGVVVVAQAPITTEEKDFN